jgi:2-isopropylmalate synthase
MDESGVGIQDRVVVFDTTLRDGEQSPGAALTTKEKLEIAHMLEDMGVDVIEAGFPISSPGDFKSVQAISAQIHGCVVCGLTRAREEDIDVAAAALKGAARPRIHTGLGVSDVHLAHKLRMSREEALEAGVKAVRRAKRYVDDVQYYVEDAGRAAPEYLYQVLEAVIDAGATVVNIPDTTGYTYPTEWGALIAGIVNHVPNIDKATVSVHCHNDLGMATANTLAGVTNGARQIECTLNGIGERAGNASLEEVVMSLRTRQDFFKVDTRIKAKLIYPASRLVSDLTGIPVQPNKAIVGANAFAHSSGIHQDGVLKERTRPASIRTGCSRSGRPTRSSTHRTSVYLSRRSCSRPVLGGMGCGTGWRNWAITSPTSSSTRSMSASWRWPTRKRQWMCGIWRTLSPGSPWSFSRRPTNWSRCR